MMTLQEMFDTIYNGLWEQNEPSKYNDICLYRSHNSDNKILKCAAGQIIPDNEYRNTWEHCLIDITDLNDLNSITQYFWNKFEHSVEHMKLLDTLQQLHDSYDSGMETFRTYINRKFGVVSEEFGLNFVSKGE